jgi:methionyl-tRNA formyltransferase
LNFAVPARRVVDQIRSLSPKPGAWMLFEGKRLKVLKAEVVVDVGSVDANAQPGSFLSSDPTGPVVATLPGAIRLVQVIPEGKPQMTGAEFAQRTASRH